MAAPVLLRPGSQADIGPAWLRLVAACPARTTAADLYRGRAIGLARTAATNADAPLYVISAGLGLLSSSTSIPAYALTVTGRGPESIRSRALGEFSAADWFDTVNASPYARPLSEPFEGGAGVVLVALTRPYAELIGRALAALPSADIARLRLFGKALEEVVPVALHCAIMPYDDRLDAICPGTRTDFSQRALAHFAEHIALSPGAGDLDHANAVRQSLAHVVAPARVKRPRLTDADVEAWILARLATTRGLGRLLRALRDEEGLACEQARFGRLYRRALAMTAGT